MPGSEHRWDRLRDNTSRRDTLCPWAHLDSVVDSHQQNPTFKNVFAGGGRASTSVAEKMERRADREGRQRHGGIGVAVTDSQHRFRSVLDILGALAPALSCIDEAERSAFLLKTFGREALGGVNAMLTQVTNGIRTNTGVTVRGAEAIAYLRDQFENAGGTAAGFREKMLNTFEGQKKLLQGSMETLAIVAGEPFAQIFKPLVTTVVEVVNAVPASYTHLRAHETVLDLVCRLLLEKKTRMT